MTYSPVALTSLIIGATSALLMLLARFFHWESAIFFTSLSSHCFHLMILWPAFFQLEWLRRSSTQPTKLKGEGTLLLVALIAWSLYLIAIGLQGSSLLRGVWISTKYILLSWSDWLGALLILLYLALSSLFLLRYRHVSRPRQWVIGIWVLSLLHSLFFTLKALAQPQSLLPENNLLIDFFWLGAGHLTLQAMTIVTLCLWYEIFQIKLEKTIWEWLFLPYLAFVILAVSLTFLESLGVNSWLRWHNEFIWLPAISSILLISRLIWVLATSPFPKSHFKISWNNQTFWGLLSLGSFAFWGGVTGMGFLLFDLYRTKALGTLQMPGHFHPLVASGVTLLFLSQLLPSKKQTLFRKPLLLFYLGIFVLAFGLTLAGFNGALRRIPIFPPQLQTLEGMIITGGSMAFLGLLLFVRSWRTNR